MRKLKIDVSELEMAFSSDQMSETSWFLDLESGNVVMTTSDDSGAVEDFFSEIEAQEDCDVDAEFEKWLPEYECPDWQRDSIRDAYLVEQGFGTRFIRVPEQDSREGYNDMADFAETVTDKHLVDLLNVALHGKGAFRRFKDVLDRYPEERERWFKFSDQRLKERILEWLESEEIELEDSSATGA